MSPRRLIAIFLTFALTALIAWGALRSIPPIPKLFAQQDKLEHILAFGALTLWLHVMFGIRKTALCSAVAVVGALALEISQALLSGSRSGSFFDFLASVMGIGLAAGFIYFARQMMTRRRNGIHPEGA